MKTETPSLNVKLIKLVTNEDIIVTLDNDESYNEDMLCIIDPVVLIMQNAIIDGNTMQVFFLRPWMQGSDDTVYNIHLSRIITIADLSDKFKDKYIEFLSSDNESDDDIEEDLDDFDNMFNYAIPDKPTYH